jgi:hypothetical protein
MQQSDSIFSKQIRGAQSYGYQDYLDHIEQLPTALMKNSNYTLPRPQE